MHMENILNHRKHTGRDTQMNLHLCVCVCVYFLGLHTENEMNGTWQQFPAVVHNGQLQLYWWDTDHKAGVCRMPVSDRPTGKCKLFRYSDVPPTGDFELKCLLWLSCRINAKRSIVYARAWRRPPRMPRELREEAFVLQGGKSAEIFSETAEGARTNWTVKI